MPNEKKSKDTDVQPSENLLPEQELPASGQEPDELEEAEKASPKNRRPEQAGPAETPHQSEGPDVSSNDASVRQNENAPASIEHWASHLNIPGWKHAALCRLYGWASGRQVSREEYQNALDMLARRRMGGGRM